MRPIAFFYLLGGLAWVLMAGHETSVDTQFLDITLGVGFFAVGLGKTNNAGGRNG